MVPPLPDVAVSMNAAAVVVELGVGDTDDFSIAARQRDEDLVGRAAIGLCDGVNAEFERCRFGQAGGELSCADAGLKLAAEEGEVDAVGVAVVVVVGDARPAVGDKLSICENWRKLTQPQPFRSSSEQSRAEAMGASAKEARIAGVRRRVERVI